ncbi:MAG: TolC family protein, partial [Bryobacteraceae bacterium]
LAGTLNPVPGTLPAPPVFAGGYGTVLGQLFGRDFPNYSIGFQLNVPLRNRAAQADMIMDQLNLRQQELQQQQQVNNIRVEVRNALIAVEQAGAAYRAALKASTLAEETLEAEQKKYALGASTIFFVIQYQRDLAQARYNEVAAESQYAKAKVQLDQATGSTLEANNISMDEAVSAKVSRLPSPLPPLQP